jgi:hypothetical protein
METIDTMTLLRPTLKTLVILAAAALAPTPAQAQQPQGATQPGATTTVATPVNPAELAIKQMVAKLRDVQAAQDGHLEAHGTYTTSMTALGRYDARLAPTRANGVRRDSVVVQIIFAGGRGWTGIASHWGLRGRSCVIYVGIAEELPKLPITRADRRTPTEEGVPACDAPPTSATPAPPAPAAAAPASPPARQ